MASLEGPSGRVKALRPCILSGVMQVAIDRYTATGDEAGTAPGDRQFRPDVQGMRAVAILLALLYHADIPGISGGYVGIEVFFVISGFVITGLLLREREANGRTSLRSFYGRRARRIIPAASLVIIVTVIVAYHYLGPLIGHETAVDGQWAALFLANFHFAAVPDELPGLAAAAVGAAELLVAGRRRAVLHRLSDDLSAHRMVGRRDSLRARLAVVLVAVIVASYAFSIVFTSTNAASAFFSPLTRAWELALGGLIAVAGHSLRRMPQCLAALISWLGLAAIVVASVTLTSASVYPGALVAIPVLGAGLVIAGGAAQPAWGVECLLRQRPFQLLGLISYSLYLWHWPILVIATQRRGVTSLPVWDNICCCLWRRRWWRRHLRAPREPGPPFQIPERRRWASIVMGLCLIAATLVGDDVRATPAHGGVSGVLATATVGLHLPLTATERRVGLEIDVYLGSLPRDEGLRAAAAGGRHRRLDLVQLASGAPSSRSVLWNASSRTASVIGCGIVSGMIAPILRRRPRRLGSIPRNVRVKPISPKPGHRALSPEPHRVGKHGRERNSIVVEHCVREQGPRLGVSGVENRSCCRG